MRRTVILLVLGLGGIVLVGAGIWLWERARRPPGARRPAERLLIGFDQNRVERVRLEMGTVRVDRRRQQGEWVPMPGFPDSGAALRMDAVLEQLATMRARLVSDDRRSTGKPGTAAMVEIAVWRGGIRPLRLSFFRKGGKVVVRTSDRPGAYEVDSGLLGLLRREMSRAGQAAAVASSPEEVQGLRLERKGGGVHVVRKGGRWFVEDGGSLSAADSAGVGRLLRMLQGIRVRERLGEGGTALAKHGLETPHYTVTLESEKPERLLVGGPCPRDPDGRVAGLGRKGESIACVGPVDESLLAASLRSDRIFSAGADEVQAVSIRRERVTLALVSRSDRGWGMISPSEAPVDQGAAQRLVTDLTALRVRPGAGAPPADGARPIGQVKVTPFVGDTETLDLYGEERGTSVRWARHVAGGRWLALTDEADRLLGADPVLLHSHALCQVPQEDVLAVLRSQGDAPAELSLLEGGVWQLVLVEGRRSMEEARRIAATLERYRPAAKPGERPTEVEWKAPVILVEEGDAELRDSLLFQASQMRARTFVAGRAQAAHRLDRSAVLVSILYRHNCRDERGKTSCDIASCAVELGGPVEGGGCYGRVPADGAIFVAEPALCETVRRPVASRRVTETPLHVLKAITLSAGRRQLSLVPREAGGWQRSDGKGEPYPAEALLFLAPLQADAVAGYGRGVKGQPVLTAFLSQPQVSPVTLRFFESAGGEGYDVHRGNRPLRYRVQAAPVKRLLELLARD